MELENHASIDEEAHLLGRISRPAGSQLTADAYIRSSSGKIVMGSICILSLVTISVYTTMFSNGFSSIQSHLSKLFVVSGEFAPMFPGTFFTAQGEDGSLVQLAAYDIDCSPHGNGQAALNGFRYEIDGMHFRYGCSSAPAPYVTMSSTQYTTDWLPIASDYVGALSQVNVYCPAESVMSEWHMNFQSPNVINIGYTCISPVPAAICTPMIDKNWVVGHQPGPISSLAYAMSPACNANAVLQGWNIALNEKNNFYFEWTCCTVGDGFAVAGDFQNMATTDGMLSNLALQDVDCSDIRGTDSPINRFQYSAKTNSYDYSCVSSSIPPSGSKSFSTTTYEGGFGGISYLDRHSVQCPNGMLLKHFKLENNEGMIHYDYECLSYDASLITCRFGYTTYADPGSVASLDSLAQHNIACNSDEAIAAFKLQTNPEDSTTVRYEFSCCTMLPSTSVSPTLEPSQEPTVYPVPNPTQQPTADPTYVPTFEPSANPVARSTEVPTLAPTPFPTMEPTFVPSMAPTELPTFDPTYRPTFSPSLEPTLFPTESPSIEPTMSPTVEPTLAPTFIPLLNTDPLGFGVLCPGMALNVGEYTTSNSLNFKLLFAEDGNLKVIDGGSSKVLWGSGNNGGVKFLFQPDGNGVVFNSDGKVTWSTMTAGRPNSIIVMQNDGNLVIYDVKSQNVLWQSETSQSDTPSLVPFSTVVGQCFTSSPTLSPTLEPTFRPTTEPTLQPTDEPTVRPSQLPTIEPTFRPTAEPTNDPTLSWAQAHVVITTPTTEPTFEPTDEPTLNPVTRPTFWPTLEPTKTPISSPTSKPSFEPTIEPSQEPTKPPISYPTFEPTDLRITFKPTLEPSFKPTPEPSPEPSKKPTNRPTFEPTFEPSLRPVAEPTMLPTAAPIADVTIAPTLAPTPSPSLEPSHEPSERPSQKPTYEPTHAPSLRPTVEPTLLPTIESTLAPIASPTLEPTQTPFVSQSLSPTGPNGDIPPSLCPFVFTKGQDSAVPPPGCVFLARDNTYWIPDGGTTNAAFVCTDSSHPLKLDFSSLQSLSLGNNKKASPSISVVVPGRDMTVTMFNEPEFEGPAMQASSVDGENVLSEVPSDNDLVLSIIIQSTAVSLLSLPQLCSRFPPSFTTNILQEVLNRLESKNVPDSVITILGVGTPKTEAMKKAASQTAEPTLKSTAKPTLEPTLESTLNPVLSNETSPISDERANQRHQEALVSSIQASEGLEQRDRGNNAEMTDIHRFTSEQQRPVDSQNVDLGAKIDSMKLKDVHIVEAVVAPTLRGSVKGTSVKESQTIKQQQEQTIDDPVQVQDKEILGAAEQEKITTKTPVVEKGKNIREIERIHKVEMQKKLMQRKKELHMIPRV